MGEPFSRRTDDRTFSKWLSRIICNNCRVLYTRNAKSYFLWVARRKGLLLIRWSLPGVYSTHCLRHLRLASLSELREEHFTFLGAGRIRFDRFTATGLEPSIGKLKCKENRIEWRYDHTTWRSFKLQLLFDGPVVRKITAKINED